MDTIGERLKKARGKRSGEDFASALGVHLQTVYRYERGDRKADADYIQLVSNLTGVSLDWIIKGEGPMMSADKENKGNQDIRPKPIVLDGPDHEIIMVPMVEARLSAGHGSFETDGTSERKYSFRSDFLRRKGNIADMVLMRVSGDSMEPAVEDGDVVLIDQSQTKPTPGKVYAVGVEDMVYLKKVNAEPGKLILLSNNRDFAPLEIDTRGDLERNVRIIGRVIWSCREW